MFRGFMDHWVPTVDSISTFWKSDIDECKQMIDNLASDIAFNNFTFYTKWYTNGISSELDFLRNHPDCSNVRTDNDWGRELIEYLHGAGMTCGAMLQCYTFEKGLWGDKPSLGEWDLRNCAQMQDVCVLADFTDDSYRDKLAQMLREQLILFPNLDYLFLEFEGIRPKMAHLAYTREARKNPDLVPIEELKPSQELSAQIERFGQEAGILCSEPVLEMFRKYMHKNLLTAQSVCDELGYRGKLGVVYYPPGYERFYMPDALPGSRWRLLPWCYFGWIPGDNARDDAMDMLFQHIREQLEAGKRVLYIGDVSITPWDTDSIEKTIQFCESHPVEGYLGMGNPHGGMGLKWHEVTDDHLAKIRQIFGKMWPV